MATTRTGRPAKPRTRKPAPEPAQCCPGHVPAGDCVPHCCARCPWWEAVVAATTRAVEIATLDVYAELGGAA